MLDLTERVKKRLASLGEDENKQNLGEEVKIAIEEIDSIYAMLEICKKNTTKKIHKLMKIESQKKEAEEQNERLQKKLETANHLLSSITSNSDASALTFEEHLHEFIRNRSVNEQIQRR